MALTDRLALAVESDALALPPEGSVLVLRAAPSPFLDLVPAGRLRCVQGFRPVHDALAATGHTVAAEAPPDAAADAPAGAGVSMVVANLGRSRAANLGDVARALDLLPAGGCLAVNGAKEDGVDSLARQVGKAIPLDGAFVKAHGRVFWLTRPAELPPEVAAWAEAARPRRNADGFLAAPGMFSPDHPDPGSRRLAAAVAGRLSGRVADLGAGWGWLAASVLAAAPRIDRLDLHEADAASLDAARANVTDPRASFHWSDVAALGRADGPCDSVIANPPFHQTRTADPDLGAAFIAAARRILKPSGHLWLVANRQLPYEAALASAFREWDKVAEDGVYKVLHAERPRRA